MENNILILEAFFFLAIIWILKKYLNYFRAVLLALKLPGPAALPIFGNILVIKDTEAFLGLAMKVTSYTPIFRIWIFFVPTFVVYEPEHLKIVLSNTKISDKNFLYDIMHNFIGDGLITSTGEKWKKHRRLIQPHFQTSILENYFEVFASASEQILTKLSGQRHIQITKTINTCVLNILHKTILGVDLNLKSEFDSPFRKGELLLLKRLLKPWLLFDSVFKHSEMSKNESKQSSDLHRYVKQILDDRRLQRATRASKPNCLLDRLIEISDFSDEDIVTEAVTFMLAGQDSVGAAVAFCLHHLAKHQDVQEKVYKEIISEGHSQKMQLDQVNRLHYLEQCIRETMRLMPSIPLIARELTTDVTLENYTIPAGSNIFISPFATHWLPHIFPNPHEFDPDRFSPENAKKLHPYGYLPFGAGPRTCIGYKFAYLEMKTIIATIIKNYSLALEKGRENLIPNYRVTMRARGGIWLDIRLRNA